MNAKKKELTHVGVMGMRWGRRKGSSETNIQRLRREANPKPWSVGKQIGVGVGLAAGVLVTPWPVGLTIAIASAAYFRNRSATQQRAQAALKKIAKKKVKDLPQQKVAMKSKE